MGVQGKTDATVEWVKGWPDLGGYIKLNSTDAETDDFALNTVYNDKFIEEYNDGTAKRNYTFALVMMADWSGGYDEVNAEAEKLGESWVDWVNEQYGKGNLPDFGEDVTIQRIESVYNIPSLAIVYEAEQKAKYMFQAKITYIE